MSMPTTYSKALRRSIHVTESTDSPDPSFVMLQCQMCSTKCKVLMPVKLQATELWSLVLDLLQKHHSPNSPLQSQFSLYRPGL
uniref:PolyADP-ribose glycohydrolase 1-like isoform X2 n=1 Tax=Rhizophora mucronata TaxID=61149 RepID=A0A2P2KS71_RHIMU